MDKKVLFLTIKRKYFDKILSGEKPTEFREYKQYYIKKFKKEYTHILLQAGYSLKSPRLMARIESIELKKVDKERVFEEPNILSNLFYCINLNEVQPIAT